MLYSKIKAICYVYATSILSFGVNLVLANKLGDEMFGYISLGIAIGGVLLAIVNLGMDKTLLRFLNSNHLKYNQSHILNAFFVNRLLILLFIIILLIIVCTIKQDYNNKTSIILYGFIVYQCLLGFYPKGIFEFTGEINIQNKLVFIERLVVFLLVCIFTFLLSFKLIQETYFMALLVLCIIFARFTSIIGQYSCFIPNLNFHNQVLNIKEDVKIGKVFTVAFLLNSTMFYGNQFILSITGNIREVASLGLALQFCLIVQLAQSQIVRFFNKKIMNDKGNVYLYDNIKISVYVSLPLVLVYLSVVIVSKGMFFQTGFDNLINHSYILALWLVFLGPGLIINQYVVANSIDSTYLKGVVLSVFLSITLSIIILKYVGGKYIAFSLMFPHLLSIIYQYYIVRNCNVKKT